MSAPNMVERCPRFGKLIGGCLFEARYDTTPKMDKVKNASGLFGEAEIAAFFHGITSKTYVRDVCVRCGKTVERPALTDQRAGG